MSAATVDLLRRAVARWDGCDDPESFAARLEAADDVADLVEALGDATPADADAVLRDARTILAWEAADAWWQWDAGRPDLETC